MNSTQLLALAGGLLVAAALIALALTRLLRRQPSAQRQTTLETLRRLRQTERQARQLDQQLHARVEELQHLAERAQALIDKLTELSDGASTGPAGDLPPLERQQDRIVHLSRQGLQPVQIARQLDLSVGEVELTLNLQRSQENLAKTGGER